MSQVFDLLAHTCSELVGGDDAVLDDKSRDGFGRGTVPFERVKPRGFGEFDGVGAREAREKFGEIVEAPVAQAAIVRVLELAEAGTVTLLSFEQGETRCHRELVLTALRTRLVSV